MACLYNIQKTPVLGSIIYIWHLYCQKKPGLHFGGVDVYADLGAEKVIVAEKEREKIAVEIKSFLSLSVITDFHTALGQFMNYRLILEQQETERTLFMAVPKDVYRTFFRLEFTQLAVTSYQLKILIYDAKQEVILKWIK